METGPKTALVLGGGGSRGAYEIGVWQALREMDLPIHIVTGSSVGAINGAMIAQGAFDLAATLWKQLETGMVFDLSLAKNNQPPLRALLEQYINEDTVRASHLDFGLVTLELPSLVPHHLFLSDIPQGKLIDYLMASASIFPAIKPQSIGNSKFVDGGYTDNVPVEMALNKGATKIIAVDLEVAGIVRKQAFQKAEDLTLIRPGANLGNMLLFRKENAGRIMRLGYLDTLKSFGFFSGSYYTFRKGQFKKKDLEGVEAAGRIFDLDPGILYTMDSFEVKLQKSVEAYAAEIKQDLEASRSRIRQKRFKLEGLLALLAKGNEKTMTLLITDFLSNNLPAPEGPLAAFLPEAVVQPWKAAAYLLASGIRRKEQ